MGGASKNFRTQSDVPVSCQEHRQGVHRPYEFKMGLHKLQLVLFLLQRYYLMGYLAVVTNAASKITLGLGDLFGTDDSNLREIRDGC